TGGIGCGKSTAAAIFERHGFSRIDSDAVIRDEILRARDVVEAIRGRFGEGVLQPSGDVNRAALAARVFPDDAERRWLEELTHPRLFERWRTAFAAKPGGNWIVEVPLLFEKGLENWFD